MISIKNTDAFSEIKRLRRKSVDLVLSDPPYDLTQSQITRIHQHLVRVSKTGVIIFCPPENQWYASPDQFGFWIKPISTKNTSKRYSRFVEMILFYGSLKWNVDRHWSQYTNVFTDLVETTVDHPYKKPESLIKRLILNHTAVGDTVLDPFIGSGTVAKCCQDLGRSCIGFELNKNCFSIANQYNQH